MAAWEEFYKALLAVREHGGDLPAEPSASLSESGYWLYAQGDALPPGHPNWGRCENCIAKPEPCWSCSLRVLPGDPPKDKTGLVAST